MSFSTSRRLRFGDCDLSGIAYFPAYLDMLVGVIEEFFAEIGAPWPELFGKQRISTPTVRLDLVFLKPGLHGAELLFTLRVKAIGKASLDLHHTISSEGEVLWSAEQRLVATSLDTKKSVAWPDDVRQALALHLEEADGRETLRVA